MADAVVARIVAKLYTSEPDPYEQRQEVERLAEQAADLHADQQAMPDPGALQEQKRLIRVAYELGRVHERGSVPSAFALDDESVSRSSCCGARITERSGRRYCAWCHEELS